jgi:zinc protease
LETIREMVRDYPDTLTEDAVETVQQKRIKSATRAFESLNAKLGTLRNISRFGLSYLYVEEQQAELVAMTPEEFQQTATDYFVEDEFIYVIVGDAETQLGPVETFASEAGKGEVIQLDIYGNPRG